MCNKFYGSKLNTVLLLILIVLLGIAIFVMCQNPDTYVKSFVGGESKIEEIEENLSKKIINPKKDVSVRDEYGRFTGVGCKIISGCNGPISCVDGNIDESNFASTCEYNPIYQCYKEKTSRCEKQTMGSCGWTLTNELNSCISKNNVSNL